MYDSISHHCCVLHLSGILELTHNHGTEMLDKTPYHSGNSEPQGFGHIAITVDDVEAACARFERLGVPFKKRLTDGKMKSLAFILDPDGYWIEVVRLGMLLSPSVSGLSFGELTICPCAASITPTILIPH